MKKIIDLECSHHRKAGSGYHYEIVDGCLWLCKKCERKLRTKILEQIKVEKEMPKIQKLSKKQLAKLVPWVKKIRS